MASTLKIFVILHKANTDLSFNSKDYKLSLNDEQHTSGKGGTPSSSMGRTTKRTNNSDPGISPVVLGIVFSLK